MDTTLFQPKRTRVRQICRSLEKTTNNTHVTSNGLLAYFFEIKALLIGFRIDLNYPIQVSSGTLLEIG